MKRRDIVKILGTGAASVVLPPWLSACDTDPEPGSQIDYDGVVGVIGAGAAGLHVADILLSQGINVVVFEASDRIGGRIQSLSSTYKPSKSLIIDPTLPFTNDFPLELGSEKIYGSDSLWGKIIENLKVPTADVRSIAPHDSYIINGVLKLGADLQTDAGYSEATNFMESLASHAASSASVEGAIVSAGVDSSFNTVLNSWIGNRYGTVNYKLGIGAIGEAVGLSTHHEKILTLKSNPMQNVLLSRFSEVIPSVKLNTQILSVEYSGDTIFLTNHLLQLAAVDKLVVTVPLAVLKSGALEFLPGLPSSKKAAMDRIGMDASLRVILEFKKPVWPESSGFIFGGITVPEYFNSGVGRSSASRFLTLTINGPKASELSAWGEGMIPVILAELDAVTNGAASENVRRDSTGKPIAVIKDWTSDPFIRGGMSYPMPGSTNADRLALASSIDNKIFFAGEATDIMGDFGTVSGALQSAERAAQEVVDSIV